MTCRRYVQYSHRSDLSSQKFGLTTTFVYGATYGWIKGGESQYYFLQSQDSVFLLFSVNIAQFIQAVIDFVCLLNTANFF